MSNDIYIGFNAIVGSHTYSLSIIYKGQVFAIEFEKINRIKDFPRGKWAKFIPTIQREMFGNIDNQTKDRDLVLSFRNYIDDTIDDILKKLDIDFRNIDNIYTINFPFDISVRGFENKVTGFKHNYHHLFHAACTYYPSSFDDAAILCMDHDGYDEELGGINPMHSIWHGKKNDIKFLYSDNFSPEKAQAGIGAVYENHSIICGIGEGTFMGLSGYGKNNLNHIKIFDYKNGGVLLSKDFLSKQSYESLEDFRNDIISGFQKAYNLDKNKDLPKSMETSIYADIADKVQVEIEEAILFLARKAYDLTGSKNICIAGGVGLNILANNRVLRETKFENIFVQPACNDAGLSLGGLYYMYHNILGNEDRIRLKSPGLGFEYKNEEIINSLESFNDKIKFTKFELNKFEVVANLLKDNKIIGWFQGKSEFGPRALGFRSILASPIDEKMKFKVNNIKEREQYRPLAPIMMEDYFKEYLDTEFPSPYMTLVSNVYENKKSKIPAVVHVDGTARYQTVNIKQNQEIYNLLNEFYKATKESVLINTSFNQHNEPIVNTPEEAIKMFLSTDIDYLVIGDYLVSKDKNYHEYKFDKNKVKDNYENKLKQAKNNNIRGETILKLLGISKLGFNYNYNKGEQKMKIFNNNLGLYISVIKENEKYDFQINDIGITVINKVDKYIKIIEIIKIYISKNNKLIYDLIKGI